MRARAVLAALLLALAGDALAQAKRVVGFWMGPCDVSAARMKALSEAMADLGWTQPGRMRWELKCVAPNLEAADVAADEVASTRPDAIVTQGTGATRALRKATSAIPIVTSVGDPVATGFAESLARPGGNVTGLAQEFEGGVHKQVEMLRRLLPRLGRLLLVGIAEPKFVELFRSAGQRHGVAILTMAGWKLEDVRRELSALPAGGTAAVYVANLGVDTAVVVRESLARGIPVMAYNAEQVEEGEALIAYQLDWRDPTDRLARVLDRVLKGAKPAELPFEQPTESFLAINNRTAERLGVKVPQDLLLQARWTN